MRSIKDKVVFFKISLYFFLSILKLIRNLIKKFPKILAFQNYILKFLNNLRSVLIKISLKSATLFMKLNLNNNKLVPYPLFFN